MKPTRLGVAQVGDTETNEKYSNYSFVVLYGCSWPLTLRGPTDVDDAPAPAR